MKKLMKKQCAAWLVLAMLLSMILPVCAYAQSVEFTAELNNSSIVKSDSAQEVVVTLKTNSPVTIDGFGVTVAAASPLSLKAFAGGESRIAFSAADYNMNNGKIGWGTADCENISDVTNLVKATVMVPADTPAGTYAITFSELELSKDYGEAYVSGTSATATLTITEPSAPSAGYTAALSCGVSEVTVGDSVSVNVGVSHDSKTAFAASEVVLGYDSAKLSFNQSASTLNGATVKASGGTLTLEDYGANKTCGTGVYVLKFDATSNGTASVGLTSAAFSDKEAAVKSDLTAATLGYSSVSLTVKKQSYAVTLPDIFTGAATVTDGESYTFTAADAANYTYAAPTATMGGAAATVTNNGNGTYTVANVTGALVISGTRTPKSYTVTFAGNATSEVTGAAATATYGTDYSFTKPTAIGWAYDVAGITIDGTAYTGYSVSGNVYTIPGTDIKGDVVITVNKSQTTASVTVAGSGAGAAAGYTATANIGSPYTLTITPVAGYDYTVTATMGGTPAVLAKNDNTYTIASVTGNIVFTVEQSVVTDGVHVSKYLQLNGTNMWLVKNETTLASGSVATYDGQPMFEKNGAYCTLVIADTLTSVDAAAKVGIATGTAVQVSGMDVNMSDKVDANDAQLTYNMYNTEYSAFTDDVTVEKFLRADVNGDGKVDVSDAAAIISEILK